MKEGIALLAHGSRDPQWFEPFERIAASLQQRLPAVAIALAYLEHGPSLEEAVIALGAKGAMSIRVVPLFLGTGGHVRDDLPKLVSQARRPDIQLALDKPIGEQAEVIAAIVAAIAAAR